MKTRKRRKLPGLFLSFEGGEGAGKTSLIDALEKELTARGLTLLRTREPGGTALGERIRSLLLDPSHSPAPYAELALFLASRAQQLHELILPALARGHIVLCDRFNDSTIAYQGAARQLGVAPVAQACRLFCQGIEPHLTFYLDIDPEVGLLRAHAARQKDRIEQETLAFHRSIRAAYRRLARERPRRIRLLDAALPPAAVFAQALAHLERRLPRVL